MFLRFVLLVSILSFGAYNSLAQSGKIPLDKAVHRGKLDNGLEYFIRQNSSPSSKVELRLVVNAGSLQEAEDQQGLAHFVEHMAFNGSKNFKKNELVDYLQSVGVKFGAHLNAYTSFDETVYMLSLPADKAEILRKGFQVLRDWAGNLSFDPVEIDKERGVVVEEWRLGLGADQRMQQKFIPVVLKDSRYAKRLPIGKKDIIEQASYETIRKFYKDWYRPNLMSVIVVGDIEVEFAKKLIEDLFSDLKNPEDAPERLVYDIPDHSETLISIVSDPENPYSFLQVFYKDDPEDLSTTDTFKKLIDQLLYTGIINMRLREYSTKPNPPFINANVNHENHLFRTKAAIINIAVVKDNNFADALKVLLEESKRIANHGVTAAELRRFKSLILNRYRTAYNERNRQESSLLADEYVRVFLEDEPSPGIAYEYNYVQQYLDTITVQTISNLAKASFKAENRVILALAPQKPDLTLPAEADLRKVIATVESKELDAYQEEVSDTALITKTLPKGTIVKKKYFKTIDTYEWTLSNGAKVVFKPTEFKEEVIMSAYSLGGHSLYEDEDYFSALYATAINSLSGVGNFSFIQLQKLLTGKLANVNPYIDDLNEGLFANSTPEDVETMLQLCYLYFTASRRSQDAVDNFKSRYKSYIKNLMASPIEVYNQEIARVMAQNHLRGNYIARPADLDKIDGKRTFEIFKERFANAADFTFFIIGQVEKERMEDLVTKYIGSLPGNSKSKEIWQDRKLRAPKDTLKKVIRKGQEPKSRVTLIFTGSGSAYSTKDRHPLISLAEVLDIKLIEELREEQSGVYGLSIFDNIERDPYPHYEIRITFACAPDKVDALIASTLAEIDKIKKQGVGAKDLNKVQKAQILEYEQNLEGNDYWLEALFKSYYYDKNPKDILNFKQKVNKLSSEILQKTAQKYFDNANYAEFILVPEK